MKTFKDIGINFVLIEKLKQLGYQKPMLVQEKCIPLILKSKSLIIESPTGSGKTLAYILPILENLKIKNNDQHIVLVPTKELGAQIFKIFKEFTDKVLFFPDEVGIKRQIEKLKNKKPNIIIAIPERFLELIFLKKININNIKYLIVDEGDKIFKEKELIISEILKKIYKNTPIYFFSATFLEKDYDLIDKYKKNIIKIKINDNNLNIKHFYIMINNNKKMQNLFYLLNSLKIKKSIIFIDTSKGIEGFYKRLLKQKRVIFKLHTKMNLNERKYILDNFKKEKFSILITNDVFSRGIDILDLECVVNYDLPKNKKNYIHRGGRTGRIGKKGFVISFVSELEKKRFFKIRSILKIPIKQIGINKSNNIIYF